ncbi:MAG: 30S ribosomal protein S6, partial [Candidatus Uhrbacteria bacterium]|nr:30S ribosomal protein S6 [Candidatus Uhrbacteria bacterium]
ARRYELLYIIPTTFTDEEAGEIETRVSGLIEKVGITAESTTRLGKLRFAYLIKDQRHGYYIMVMLNADPSAIAKLDGQLRITPEVLRYMIISADEAGSEAKYELVQFTEVNVEDKDTRSRRRPSKDGEEKKEATDVKKDEASKTEETV